MSDSLKKIFISSSLLTVITAFAYQYPRSLVSLLGENSPWISYLYTYGMGFIVFLLSLFWIGTRKKIDPQRRKQERVWIIAISCGFLLMFGLHGLWIFLAIDFPVKN